MTDREAWCAWGRKELDTTEWLNWTLQISWISRVTISSLVVLPSWFWTSSLFRVRVNQWEVTILLRQKMLIGLIWWKQTRREAGFFLPFGWRYYLEGLSAWRRASLWLSGLEPLDKCRPRVRTKITGFGVQARFSQLPPSFVILVRSLLWSWAAPPYHGVRAGESVLGSAVKQPPSEPRERLGQLSFCFWGAVRRVLSASLVIYPQGSWKLAGLEVFQGREIYHLPEQ